MYESKGSRKPWVHSGSNKAIAAAAEAAAAAAAAVIVAASQASAAFWDHCSAPGPFRSLDQFSAWPPTHHHLLPNTLLAFG